MIKIGIGSLLQYEYRLTSLSTVHSWVTESDILSISDIFSGSNELMSWFQNLLFMY